MTPSNSHWTKTRSPFKSNNSKNNPPVITSSKKATSTFNFNPYTKSHHSPKNNNPNPFLYFKNNENAKENKSSKNTNKKPLKISLLIPTYKSTTPTLSTPLIKFSSSSRPKKLKTIHKDPRLKPNKNYPIKNCQKLNPSVSKRNNKLSR
jgi:hypothetical protein